VTLDIDDVWIDARNVRDRHRTAENTLHPSAGAHLVPVRRAAVANGERLEIPEQEGVRFSFKIARVDLCYWVRKDHRHVILGHHRNLDLYLEETSSIQTGSLLRCVDE